MRIGLLILIVYFSSLIIASAQENPSGEKVVVSGKIFNDKTKEPIEAELDIFYDSDFIIEDVQIAEHGEYSENLKHFGWYILQVSAPGYLDKTDTIWVTSENRKSIKRDFYLTPIEVGLSVVLQNVYFYFGQTILKEDSYPALNEVAEFFKKNPQITFEIGGHTDDEGADDYNLMLSEGRAKAVVEYLVKQGIDPSRLQARGYGETKPLDKGITKAAKARNRRVEFVVVSTGS